MRLCALAVLALSAGCNGILGLDGYKTLDDGAHCGFDVPGWACADGSSCDDATHTCVKVVVTGGSGGTAGSAGGGSGGDAGTGGGGAGGGGNGGGGQGGMPECTSGTKQPCYTFDPLTKGIGNCKDGLSQCINGTWGPCEGDVGPQAETCLDSVDNDCDGQVNEEGAGCVCLPNSSLTCYSGPAGTLGVGACTSGTQTCNADGTGPTGACSGEVTPAMFEGCGDAVDDDCNGYACGWTSWAKFHPVLSVAGLGADDAGDFYLGGLYDQSIDFGGGQLPPSGIDAYLLKVDGQGNYLWAKKYNANLRALVVDGPSGEVTLAGNLDGNANFGCGLLSGTVANPVAFLARIAPDGSCIWSVTIGDATSSLDLVAVEQISDGSVIALGKVNGTIQGIYTSQGDDAFVTHVDAATGAEQATTFLSAVGQQIPVGLAVDAGDSYAIAGFTGGAPSYSFNGGPMLTSPWWVMRLDSSDNVLFAKDQTAGISSLATLPDGEVLVAGTVPAGGTGTFGTDTMTAAGYHMGYVGRFLLNSIGSVIFSWSTNGNVFEPRIAWGGDQVLAGIRFDGIASMGFGILGPADAVDVAIGGFFPNGMPATQLNPKWDHFMTGAFDQTQLRIARTSKPAVAFAVQTSAPLDVGNMTYVGAGIGWVFGLVGS